MRDAVRPTGTYEQGHHCPEKKGERKYKLRSYKLRYLLDVIGETLTRHT
jgi:hypothetical protein